jgi:glycosyl-4,4'-diaponeurosporenoate acyltransferase
MTALGFIANFAGWPVLQIMMGFAATRLPPHLFAEDCWLTAPRRWERGGALYRKWLAIRRWKGLLPDGAACFGGIAKKSLVARDSAYLVQFANETRRSEIAHWCMLACFPVFCLWNPAWACWVMVAYAFAANLPCIVVQRYNRMTLQHLSAVRRHTRVTR